MVLAADLAPLPDASAGWKQKRPESVKSRIAEKYIWAALGKGTELARFLAVRPPWASKGRIGGS
jgi:hypothetical protein